MKDLLGQLNIYMENTLFLFIANYQEVYTELPTELKNSIKGLMNIKNDDNKCFLWYHTRHLNPLKTHPERITKVDKKWLMILIIKTLSFLYLKKIIKGLNKKIIFAFMYFVIKMTQFILFIYQNKNLKIVWIYC